MKNTKTLFISIFLACFIPSFSQIEIGYKTDINGEIFDGYHDPFCYNPKNKISYMHESGSYEIGYYYDKNNQKNEGLIKYKNKKIWFKQEKHGAEKALKPDDVNALVIGIDSFIVIKNFEYKKRVIQRAEFAKYITKIDNNIYAKRFHFTSELTNKTPIIITYLVKEQDNEIWQELSDDESEKENKFFKLLLWGDQNKKDKDEEKEDKIMSIIKSNEYQKKYENNQPIYYNQFWEEVNNKKNAVYKAIINSKKNAVWDLTYFKGNIKLYRAHYKSFYPYEKEGDFTIFYPDGTTRKTIKYINDEPVRGCSFYPNGDIKSEFNYKKVSNTDNDESYFKIRYTQLYTQNGARILDILGSGERIYKDLKSGIEYIQHINKCVLESSFRKEGKTEIHQLTNVDEEITINAIDRKFSTYMMEKENQYDSALYYNAQGIILLSFITDEKGFVTKCSILNKLHPDLDRLAKDFVEQYILPQDKNPHRFKKLIKQMGAKNYEFVIPLEFSIKRFYKAPRQNYYNNYWLMHWQQNMMMNNFNNLPKPNIQPAYRF